MNADTQHPADGREVLDNAQLSASLAASWRRSIGHGLRRQDRALFGDSVSRVRARRVAEDNADLIALVTPEMQRLYSSLGSARWLALCINACGEVVHSVGDRTSAPRELRVLMHPGRLLVEAEIGTTAPGCVLADRQPVVVNRGEHFLHELQSFFCASAPILRPDGELAGALDISGIDVEVLPLANDMVGLAVRGIENSMLAGMTDCVLLRFHCDERLLGTPFEGVLAVASDGSVSGANQTASRLLALGESFGIGTSVDSIFDQGLDGILRRASAQRGAALRLRSHVGSVAYLTVEWPRRGASQTVARASALAPQEEGGRSAASPFIVLDNRLQADFSKTVRVLSHGLPILIEGETGTGKEVFARALHRAVRPEGPFVAVNCAAIPEGLIEAELFGYANGAFTGARRGGAAGKIEHAHQGTLFLDEIGDMPLAMQNRLLRVLQERAVVRIGECREVAVDMLVIGATHRRLAEMVAEGRFREDLYFRLSGHTVRLPPLREWQNVTELIEAMLRRRCEALGLARSTAPLHELIAPDAMRCLSTRTWPGNIRQVEHVVHVLMALVGAERPIEMADLPHEIVADPGSAVASTASASAPPADAAGIPMLQAAESAAIRTALREHGGNVTAAARSLGIARSTLYVKMARLGLS